VDFFILRVGLFVDFFIVRVGVGGVAVGGGGGVGGILGSIPATAFTAAVNSSILSMVIMEE
jgi:hypothetical protein